MIGVVANFSALRRRYGVSASNLVAEEVARRASELAPSMQVRIVGRDRIEIEGRVANREVVVGMADRLESAFRDELVVGAGRYAIDLRIGGATCPAERFDEVRLLEEAERALEQARSAELSVLREVQSVVGANGPYDLAGELRPAIADGDLCLQYQPKVHIRRRQVVSVEALVRWRHPVHGLIMPGDFIPLAERTRDIVDLTLWTIGQVIGDQRALAANGHDLPIFVNVSGVLLSDADFVRRASALVKSSGGRIGFEITETAVIRDPESAIANLHAFADIGVSLSIDDYGAGLSSLAYLKRMPASELKIDKLFITHLTTTHRDPLIVRSTIDLAHAMEMQVVAEGVETPAALALLSVMGCDIAQGFLISRPVNMPALLRFLKADRITGFEPMEPIFPVLAKARYA